MFIARSLPRISISERRREGINIATNLSCFSQPEESPANSQGEQSGLNRTQDGFQQNCCLRDSCGWLWLRPLQRHNPGAVGQRATEFEWHAMVVASRRCRIGFAGQPEHPRRGKPVGQDQGVENEGEGEEQGGLGDHAGGRVAAPTALVEIGCDPSFDFICEAGHVPIREGDPDRIHELS